MGKFEGVLLLTDIDGTLTDDKGIISKENALAIRCFEEEGGLFSIASGRFPDFIEQFAPEVVPNTWVIGLNGGMLYDLKEKKVIWSMPLEDTFSQIAMQAVSLCPQIVTIVFSTPEGDKVVKREEFKYLSILLKEFPRPCYKLIFIFDQERPDSERMQAQRKLTALFSDHFFFDFSWSVGLEMYRKESGKASCLAEMKKLLADQGIWIRRTVCVGDYENDIRMLQMADTGYAVENALPQVKAAADRVTVSHKESAIAAVIKDLEQDLSDNGQ